MRGSNYFFGNLNDMYDTVTNTPSETGDKWPHSS
jgi:hypothetical protein